MYLLINSPPSNLFGFTCPKICFFDTEQKRCTDDRFFYVTFIERMYINAKLKETHAKPEYASAQVILGLTGRFYLRKFSKKIFSSMSKMNQK